MGLRFINIPSKEKASIRACKLQGKWAWREKKKWKIELNKFQISQNFVVLPSTFACWPQRPHIKRITFPVNMLIKMAFPHTKLSRLRAEMDLGSTAPEGPRTTQNAELTCPAHCYLPEVLGPPFSAPCAPSSPRSSHWHSAHPRRPLPLSTKLISRAKLGP